VSAPEPFSHVERVTFRDLDALGHVNDVELVRYDHREGRSRPIPDELRQRLRSGA
jgi:acyl-CoA thioesterase FadM